MFATGGAGRQGARIKCLDYFVVGVAAASHSPSHSRSLNINPSRSVTDHLLDRGHTQPRSLIKVTALLVSQRSFIRCNNMPSVLCICMCARRDEREREARGVQVPNASQDPIWALDALWAYAFFLSFFLLHLNLLHCPALYCTVLSQGTLDDTHTPIIHPPTLSVLSINILIHFPEISSRHLRLVLVAPLLARASLDLTHALL